MTAPDSPTGDAAQRRPSRYLVIANRTTDSDTLRDALLDRAARGDAEFVVMVPVPQLVNAALATLATDPVGGIIYSLPVSEAEEVQELEYAQQRLDALVSFLIANGGTASGWITRSDPITATDDALSDGRFDEIVISTLPAGLSRWLKMDLPRRLQRHAAIPVTHVEAVAEQAQV
jgi:hypothetical protein